MKQQTEGRLFVVLAILMLCGTFWLVWWVAPQIRESRIQMMQEAIRRERRSPGE